MDNISQNEKLSTIVKALDSKRAEDIRIIEIGDLTIVADYFVIANGTSSTQTKALAEEVEFKMSQLGISFIKFIRDQRPQCHGDKRDA